MRRLARLECPRSSTARVQSDRGETLLELLVSITVMGVVVVALSAAVIVTIDASSLDRRQIQAQSMLRSWAEFVVNRTTDSTYVSCAHTYDYNDTTSAGVPTAPRFSYAAFTATLPAGTVPAKMSGSATTVEYWDTAPTAPATPGFQAACPSPDQGLQRVTLQVTVDSTVWPGFTVSEVVVVRKPCNTLAPITNVPTC